MINVYFFFRSASISAMGVLVAAFLFCPVPARSMDLKTFTLANGLQGMVIENHRLPMVTHMVWYRVGSADDPPGQSGIAHLLEHMMFKGKIDPFKEEFSRIISRNGGVYNAATDNNTTFYYQTIAANRLELVMQLEAERMRALAFSPADFQTEYEVVREERRLWVDTQPEALLYERVQAALWGIHPYRNPVIGWDHELKALKQEEVIAFHTRWYAPNNAFIIVTGDVTVDHVQRLAEKHYGNLPARPVPNRLRPPLPTPRADTVIEMRHPEVRQPSWSRVYAVPSRRTPTERTVTPYAAYVLVELLEYHSNNRLYQSLVIDKKLALDVQISYGEYDVDFGTFIIDASPRGEEEIPDMVEAINTELNRFLENGVTAEDVAHAQSRLQAEQIYLGDSLDEIAGIMGKFMSDGQTLNDIVAWPERIAAVTPQDVMATAKRIFKESPHVSGVLCATPPATP